MIDLIDRLMNGHHHSQTTPVITTDVDAVDDTDDENFKSSTQAEIVEVKESTIEMSGDYYPPPPPPLLVSHDLSLSPVSGHSTPRKDMRYDLS